MFARKVRVIDMISSLPIMANKADNAKREDIIYIYKNSIDIILY